MLPGHTFVRRHVDLYVHANLLDLLPGNPERLQAARSPPPAEPPGRGLEPGMQPAGEEVATTEDRRHPWGLAFAQLEHHAIHPSHVDVVPVHQLLIQDL